MDGARPHYDDSQQAADGARTRDPPQRGPRGTAFMRRSWTGSRLEPGQELQRVGVRDDLQGGCAVLKLVEDGRDVSARGGAARAAAAAAQVRSCGREAGPAVSVRAVRRSAVRPRGDEKTAPRMVSAACRASSVIHGVRLSL